MLMMACVKGYNSVVEMLIKKGANVNTEVGGVSERAFMNEWKCVRPQQGF